MFLQTIHINMHQQSQLMKLLEPHLFKLKTQIKTRNYQLFHQILVVQMPTDIITTRQMEKFLTLIYQVYLKALMR